MVLDTSALLAILFDEPERLDDCSPSELEEVWLDEAERRAAEIDGGHVELVPSEVVSRKAQALLR